jgi:hypothetical protein
MYMTYRDVFRYASSRHKEGPIERRLWNEVIYQGATFGTTLIAAILTARKARELGTTGQ